MNSSLSIQILKRTSYSVSFMFCLSSCSVLKSNDHQVKDSLYVWSESFDESVEANKVVTDYQTIKSLEESIPKSDVQMIFDAMVNNEIPEIDLAEDLSTPIQMPSVINSKTTEQETLKQRNAKLKAYNAKLKEHNDKLRETINNKKGLVVKNNKPELQLSSELAIASAIDTKPEKLGNPENKQKEPASVSSVSVNSEFVKIDDAELNSADDINRLNQANPTAAGISIDAVLPAVNEKVNQASLPDTLQVLASQAESQNDKTEFGMWQLVQGSVSQFQEVCSLSSSTIQLEDERYSTQVWLNVIGNDLLVNTTTNIDINKLGVGLRFDNGTLQTFNKNYFQTSAVWSGDIDTALKNNKQLKISLGGNELGRRTQELSISLKHLKNAYAEYSQCNKGIQIGSL